MIPTSPEIDRNFVNIFGPLDQYEGSAYDLKHLAHTVNASDGPKPRILQLCGTKDPLYPQNMDFADFMKQECPNIDHSFQASPGIHNFNYWDRESLTMLKFFDLLP